MRFVRSGNPCTRVRPRSRFFSASVQKRFRVGSKEFGGHRVRRCACSTLPKRIPNSYWQLRAHARSKSFFVASNTADCVAGCDRRQLKEICCLVLAFVFAFFLASNSAVPPENSVEPMADVIPAIEIGRASCRERV